jgi:hypothetical protein
MIIEGCIVLIKIFRRLKHSARLQWFSIEAKWWVIWWKSLQHCRMFQPSHDFQSVIESPDSQVTPLSFHVIKKMVSFNKETTSLQTKCCCMCCLLLHQGQDPSEIGVFSISWEHPRATSNAQGAATSSAFLRKLVQPLHNCGALTHQTLTKAHCHLHGKQSISAPNNAR